LLQWLERKGLLESASRLLQRSELSIKSSGSMLTHVQAVERFKQVLDGFHRYQMEVERTRVLGDVDAWSDSGRLMELGKQKDQMRRVAHFILPEE
jgi:hypothetical protein